MSYDAGMMAQGVQLDWDLSPTEALARWPADWPVVLLHSGRVDARWSRWSILARPRGTYQLAVDAHGALRGQWLGNAGVLRGPVRHRPFADLRLLQHSAGAGLWAGYLSYDVGRHTEHLPPHRCVDRQFPLMAFHYCPDYLIYDGLTRQWHATGDAAADLPKLMTHDAPFASGEVRMQQTRQEYEAAVSRALRYIGAGDIFQVNLAQRLTASLRGSPPLSWRALYGRLAHRSPAWYGAYMELAADDVGVRRALASTSPELFVQMDDEGRVWTRPIKGTRPSHVPARELLESEKDAAELHMIVDLLRNDLGRVCDYGSVRVESPRTIETHPTVHHGVATIRGQLHRSKDLADLLRATMPGGSITGVPKIRAMQIIDELEPVARGPYCGSIGYFTRDEACFNIAIRTMLLEQQAGMEGRVDFSVGGGIVADSQPEAEYQETLDKAAAMLAVLRDDASEATMLDASPSCGSSPC